MREVARGREDYYALASSLGCGFLRSSTNFVCVDFSTEQRASKVMNALLLHGVFVRKPAAAPLDRFVRISVGTPPERAQLALRLQTVLSELDA